MEKKLELQFYDLTDVNTSNVLKTSEVNFDESLISLIEKIKDFLETTKKNTEESEENPESEESPKPEENPESEESPKPKENPKLKEFKKIEKSCYEITEFKTICKIFAEIAKSTKEMKFFDTDLENFNEAIGKKNWITDVEEVCENTEYFEDTINLANSDFGKFINILANFINYGVYDFAKKKDETKETKEIKKNDKGKEELDSEEELKEIVDSEEEELEEIESEEEDKINHANCCLNVLFLKILLNSDYPDFCQKFLDFYFYSFIQTKNYDVNLLQNIFAILINKNELSELKIFPKLLENCLTKLKYFKNLTTIEDQLVNHLENKLKDYQNENFSTFFPKYYKPKFSRPELEPKEKKKIIRKEKKNVEIGKSDLEKTNKDPENKKSYNIDLKKPLKFWIPVNGKYKSYVEEVNEKGAQVKQLVNDYVDEINKTPIISKMRKYDLGDSDLESDNVVIVYREKNVILSTILLSIKDIFFALNMPIYMFANNTIDDNYEFIEIKGIFWDIVENKEYKEERKKKLHQYMEKLSEHGKIVTPETISNVQELNLEEQKIVVETFDTDDKYSDLFKFDSFKTQNFNIQITENIIPEELIVNETVKKYFQYIVDVGQLTEKVSATVKSCKITKTDNTEEMENFVDFFRPLSRKLNLMINQIPSKTIDIKDNFENYFIFYFDNNIWPIFKYFPEILHWAFNHVFDRIIEKMIGNFSISSPSQNLPYCEFLLRFCNRYNYGFDVLLGKIMKNNLILIPANNLNENEDFSEQYLGVLNTYAALFASLLAYDILGEDNFRIYYAWYYFTNIISQVGPNIGNIGPSIIYNFIIYAGNKFYLYFGNQYIKYLKYLKDVYLPAGGKNSNHLVFQRLNILLENILENDGIFCEIPNSESLGNGNSRLVHDIYYGLII